MLFTHHLPTQAKELEINGWALEDSFSHSFILSWLLFRVLQWPYRNWFFFHDGLQIWLPKTEVKFWEHYMTGCKIINPTIIILKSSCQRERGISHCVIMWSDYFDMQSPQRSVCSDFRTHYFLEITTYQKQSRAWDSATRKSGAWWKRQGYSEKARV